MEKGSEYNFELLLMGGLLGVILQWMKPLNSSLLRIQLVLCNTRLGAVLKRLSKVITQLWLLRLVIGLKVPRKFFSQLEVKPKQIAPCTRNFSRALSKLQVIARYSDCVILLIAPVVIGQSTSFSFLTVI